MNHIFTNIHTLSPSQTTMLTVLLYMFNFVAFAQCQNCPDGYTLIRDDCFQVFNLAETTWGNAPKSCEKLSGSVAVIKDCLVLGDLVRYFHVSGFEPAKGFWISASDTAEEGNWVWSDGTNVSIGTPYWGKVQVDSAWVQEPSGGVAENCAMLSPSDQLRFHDEDCTKSAFTICQTDIIQSSEVLIKKEVEYSNDMKEGTCSDGFDYVNGMCYSVVYDDAEKKNWLDARKYCVDKASDLAVINGCDLFSDLVGYLDDVIKEGDNFWLGASDKNDEGSWYWVDYSPVALGPPFWGSVNGIAEPMENSALNCAVMSGDDFYYFHSFNCNELAYIVCQKEPET